MRPTEHEPQNASAAGRTPRDDEVTPHQGPTVPHRGFIVDAATGVLGCTRAVCSGNAGHRAAPGVFVGGFVGGNIGGYVELGVRGGWGTMRARAEAGQSPMSYWNIAPAAGLEQLDWRAQLGEMPALQTFMQPRTLRTRLSTVFAAPTLRVHFVPRGRVIAFAGAGAGYGGFRSDYVTSDGALDVAAHGIAVPAEVGLGAHLSKHVALVARFDYVWTRYFLVGLDHGDDSTILPTSMVDKMSTSGKLREELPHFWTVSLGLRLRLF